MESKITYANSLEDRIAVRFPENENLLIECRFDDTSIIKFADKSTQIKIGDEIFIVPNSRISLIM